MCEGTAQGTCFLGQELSVPSQGGLSVCGEGGGAGGGSAVVSKGRLEGCV